MSIQRRLTTLTLAFASAFVLLSIGASAQTVPRPTESQAEQRVRPRALAADAERQELLARLAGVLYSTANDAKDWRDRAAAARVQAQVADLTWELDRTTARSYLQRAWETAGSIEDENERSPYLNVSKRAEVRRELLLVARRRAPDIAAAWLDEMTAKPESRKSSVARGLFDDRSERSALLLRAAADIVQEKPGAAAELAVESLRDGVSFGLQGVLLSIQAKDFDLARKVFGAALARVRAVGVSDPGELIILYSYLYTPGLVFGADQSGGEDGLSFSVSRDRISTTPAAAIDRALARSFLKTAADILSGPPPPSPDPRAAALAQASAIRLMLGEIARQLPAEASMLQARLAQVSADAPSGRADAAPELSGEMLAAAAQSREDSTALYLASLERRAERETDPLARETLYATAALATPDESFERGLGLAEKVDDGTVRLQLQSLVRYRAALHFARGGDLEKAYAINGANRDGLQQAAVLVVCAQGLIKAKMTTTADQWLREAVQLLDKADAGESRPRVALGVAAAYMKFDTTRALEALSLAVKFMNNTSDLPLDDKAPFKPKFSGLPLTDFTFDTNGFGLVSVISASGLKDFDRVLGELDNISSPENRGAAVVLLCHRHLNPGRAVSPSR